MLSLFYSAVMHGKDEILMASSVDTDQTAPCRSSLIWVFTDCSEQSITVSRISVVCVLTVTKISMHIYTRNQILNFLDTFG